VRTAGRAPKEREAVKMFTIGEFGIPIKTAVCGADGERRHHPFSSHLP
jgi:hypothetical protein